MENIPTVYAKKETRNGVNLFTFDCPNCGKKHTHGYSEGHRVSDCEDRNLLKNGYDLKEG